MKPACIAIDFDSTLSQFRGGKEGLFAIFTQRGVPEGIVLEAYESAKERGFSIEKFQKGIEERTQWRFITKQIRRAFDAWVENAIVPYPESHSVVLSWKAQNIPVVIVTRGDPDYQRQKVVASKIPHDALYCVETEEGKVSTLRTLIARYGEPIIFIDDKVGVHDLIRENSLDENQVVTVIIRRPDSSHFNDHSVYQHYEVEHLDDVGQMIPFFSAKPPIR